MAKSTTERTWIKVGEDPLRYEYGRKGGPQGPEVVDQLAYVEEESRSAYFRWETYGEHASGAEPSREEAQEAAVEALIDEGLFGY